jgi:uncharacterized membrane protein YtjA (UPF0391 family)
MAAAPHRGAIAGKTQQGGSMLNWAVTFLVIALIAGVLGLTGVAGAASQIAWILFVLFIVLFLVSLIAGRGRPPL